MYVPDYINPDYVAEQTFIERYEQPEEDDYYKELWGCGD